MSLQSLADASANEAFQRRCQVALWGPAQDIFNEDENAENHVARADWANRVFTGALNIAPEQLAMQVLRNPTIAAMEDPTQASDGDIQFQIGVVLSDLVKIG